MGVLAAAVAVGLLAGVMGAPSAQARPTGFVEVNELWHSRTKHWMDFNARMQLGEEKDAKSDPHFKEIVTDVEAWKKGRENYQALKQQRVAKYQQELKASLIPVDANDPAAVDASTPSFYKASPEATGQIIIPDDPHYGTPVSEDA